MACSGRADRGALSRASRGDGGPFFRDREQGAGTELPFAQWSTLSGPVSWTETGLKHETDSLVCGQLPLPPPQIPETVRFTSLPDRTEPVCGVQLQQRVGTD